jgi:hypothetical protein
MTRRRAIACTGAPMTPRSFRREAGDELLDACAYLAMALVRNGGPR